MSSIFLISEYNQNLILIIFAALAVLAIIAITVVIIKGLIKTALTIFTLLLSASAGVWVYLKTPILLSSHFSSIPAYTDIVAGALTSIILLAIITKILNFILNPFSKN